jgi:hypothetical protein
MTINVNLSLAAGIAQQKFIATPYSAVSAAICGIRIGRFTMSNVFVSHRGADAVQAKRLAEQIRAAGHSVWLGEWEINIGDSIVERIDSGLEGANYVVVCYSSAGVMAPWMSREWMVGLARQLEGKGVKLLPARLTGGEPPAILADIKYADLVADWGRGVADLLRAIR